MRHVSFLLCSARAFTEGASVFYEAASAHGCVPGAIDGLRTDSRAPGAGRYCDPVDSPKQKPCPNDVNFTPEDREPRVKQLNLFLNRNRSQEHKVGGINEFAVNERSSRRGRQ